ncbi:MAG: glycosyltransferase family 4 protein [Vicinamibacterales bacterium]
MNQWVPAAHRGDAIGDSAMRVREILRRRGHISELYAMTMDDDLRGDVRSWVEADARRGDVTIFHFALPSPMTAAFATLDGGRVLQYHNITPAHYFAPYDPGMFRLAVVGRDELATLAGHVDLALGDSQYNCDELDRLGFVPTGVFPIAVNLERLTSAPRRPALAKVLGDGLTNILFVGRIAPNKKVDDHIRLAEHYKRYVDAFYRFIFVGKVDAVPTYYATVRALMIEFQMPADRFLFTGPLPDDDLAEIYRQSHAYVSLSEHEGFCVPLVEAMAMEVPVLAFGAAAVPETLGGAGLSFAPKDLELAAELLGTLVFDESVRRRIVEGQRERLSAFGEARMERAVDQLLESFA